MKNPAASVRARLLNLSRESGEPFDVLIEQYATGRFLYRLANSIYRERFILKGAQLFRIWGAEQHRPTRDLDFPPARLLIYPPETVIAEKLEAAVSFGLDNSRMKDFFDLHWLSQHQKFTGDLLIESVQATFARRKTPIPKNPPIALTEAFPSDAGKILQWDAFRRKGRLSTPGLADVINKLAAFLQPILNGDAEGQVWSPETGWTESPS